jgi:hypothetical protein
MPAGVFIEWIIDLYATASIIHKQTININLTVKTFISALENDAVCLE